MEMKIVRQMKHLLWVSSLLLLSCGSSDEAKPTGEPALVVGQSEQSACKAESKSDFPGGDKGTVEVSEQDGRVVIWHKDAYYNCASKVILKATLSGKDIAVQEEITNPEEVARCVCHYDLSLPVEGLTAGTYTVSITTAEGTLVGTAQLTIGATAPIVSVTETLQSACKQDTKSDSTSDPESSLEVSTDGDSVTIIHKDVQYNCAAKLEIQATVQGTTIQAREVITNPEEQAQCFCPYDLQVSVKGLASGTYEVELYQASGELAGEATVSVGALPLTCGSPALYQMTHTLCAAMDAKGDGLCNCILGFAWNGSSCEGLSGCVCVGNDCDALAQDQKECQTKHAACP